MSTKASIIIVVVCVIGFGGWWYMSHNKSSSTPAPIYQTTAQATAVGSTTTVSSIDNSDAALNQDLNKVDTQMNYLNSDSATAAQGISNPNQ